MAKLASRLAIALLFILFALWQYYGSAVENPVTGEQQHIQLSIEDEITLGREARDQLATEYGGFYANTRVQNYIAAVGDRLVEQSVATNAPYPFEFHVLDDPQTINAFALPGGQVFITTALLGAMTNEAQVAGVLGHEIAHVVARHGAEHVAKQQLGQFLFIAIAAAAGGDDQTTEQAEILAKVVNGLISLKYSREDETESDYWGFEFMTEAGYTPQGIVDVMEILQAAGGGGIPEFLSSHPDPGNRIRSLEEMIAVRYPDGIPPQLEAGTDRFAPIQNRLPGGN
ncbi:MAG: M48 family metalloprotease [Spirulina sp. SIO3F2]|nr:M48 family metalloprotease [Spirulina sp. SIO3F2]